MPDTSCIVPLLASEHVHAARASDAIDNRLARGETMILAAHTLLETYANLTSAPRGPRPSPAQAVSLLDAFVARATRVVALDGPAYGALLPRLARRMVAGGAVYDALIYECARTAPVDVLLSFNQRDFARFGTEVRLVVP
ncbi:MAG: PIN domain-containing protein [Dehalococcoidia bacterium]